MKIYNIPNSFRLLSFYFMVCGQNQVLMEWLDLAEGLGESQKPSLLGKMALPPQADQKLSTGGSGFEVDGSDIVKLVLQFLHEQGLVKAARELQAESGQEIYRESISIYYLSYANF